jgi:hypothetical protein
VQFLRQYAAAKAEQAKADKAEAIRLAQSLGYPLKETTKDGRHRELMRFIGRKPVYYETMNVEAAVTVGVNKLWPGGLSGLNLTGSGVWLAEWDEGSALTTHQELVGRVTNPDDADAADHSTHVAGTIMATGVVAAAKGMSFEATLHSYPWDNDSSEMAMEAANGLVASNHSYGWDEWDGYDEYSVDRDTIAYAAPYYLICQAAGNDGYWGYGTLIEPAYSKDIMVVGAISPEAAGYTDPNSVSIAWFSSLGPTFDGRIKPDIVSPGVNTYSCSDASNTAYEEMSGTSMATPVVTGSMGLLTQYWMSTHSNAVLRAATMKALLLGTADQAGYEEGPSYTYGWGQLDTYSAAWIMQDSLTTADEIQEQTLTSGVPFTQVIDVDGNLPIRATLSWTDPPGVADDSDSTPNLVNDLDLRIENNGVTYYPYVLDMTNPAAEATTGDNSVDNVEQVYFQPVAGSCTVTVSNKGTLQSGTQPFSLVITGISSADLTGLSATPTALTSGESSTGTVTLSGPASIWGAKVKLSCTNYRLLSIPTSVKVSALSSNATFGFSAQTVEAPTTVYLTATYGAYTYNTAITLNPSWLTGLTLSPSTVAGGSTSTGTVTLGAAAPAGGAVVTLASTNTAAATVNWEVTIPAGETSATFTVNTSKVAGTQTATIMAAYPGPTVTATLTVEGTSGVSGLTLSPSTIPGGGTSTGTVTLAQPAPSGGASVQLSSSNAAATVPSTVTVLAGHSSATFKVTTSSVSQATVADITASYGGSSEQAALTISTTPSAPLSLSFSPSSVEGGSTSVGTVTSSVAAPAGGLIVKLAVSNSTFASVPKSVVIPAGSYTATFNVTTKAVHTTTVETITASAIGKSAKGTVTITH